MCASRRSAGWPQLIAISLIGIGVASCSADSGRFNEGFGPSNPPPRGDVTGSIQSAPAGHIESRPLPHLGSAGDGSYGGTSGGGRGMGSYQAPNAEVTGSIAAPPPPPPPAWTWEGGTAVTVAPGETLETIAHRHGVPVSAVMQANNITSPAMVHPGTHLVIPRYHSAPVAGLNTPAASAEPRYTSSVAAPVGPPRSALAAPSSVHVVAPGETLNSIARLYNKPVMVLAKANNIPPTTMVRVGDRIVIPDVRQQPRQTTVASAAPVAAPAVSAPMTAPPRPQPVITQSAGPNLAAQQSPLSARVAAPTATQQVSAEDEGAKTAESGSPGFRWPVRGRVIQAFGPKPNGLQNDGINLAVPEGTPVKAAEDGVVAYAGNELKGYGNLVLVRHPNGFVTAYAHASDILVKRGDAVKRGQVIAHSGQTGNVTSPQLHFEIRKGATPVDPAQYLSGA
ncbi:MAG TPA: LysM peptidoglycan-binding domain-containing M23 family metallopeptidase [Xanthobacteraceae bacterium]|jgi:murein DD-endopeptidase MepM/ murein hydrolase activator NlpD|nr:LysM peptidoglycan-binding domain-containing M23 family metallopeptidase [Xanthobacteraceae bacterium]